MKLIFIRWRHSKRDANSLIPPEVLVLKALLKEGKCSQNKLIREYGIHPQQISRAVRSLRDKDLIQQDETIRLTQKGEEVARELGNYLAIQKKPTRFPYVLRPAEGQVSRRLINVGGGEAETARLVDGIFYPTQFSFKGSMVTVPGETVYIQAVKGTPLVSFEDI